MAERTTNLIIDLVDAFRQQMNALLNELLKERSAELTEHQQRLEQMVQVGQELATARTELIKANDQLMLKQRYITALEAKIKQLSK